MTDLFLLLFIFFVVFITNPLIVIIHELGHAFAYLWLTKPTEIDIYIGGYKMVKSDRSFKLGKIRFYVKKWFPFIKGKGLCKSDKLEEDYKKHIVISLAGSVFTVLSAGSALLIVLLFAQSNILALISCYIFLGLSVVSLLYNLIPYEHLSIETILEKDNEYDSDGQQILFDLKIKKARPLYIQAINLWDEIQFELAIEKMEELINCIPPIQKIYQYVVTLCLHTKQNSKAEKYLFEMEKHFELSASDLTLKGYLLSLAKKNDEAIAAYSLALKKEKNHGYALNNIGFELIEKGAHQVAASALERAIKKYPTFSEPYNNLGYSKILQGDLEEGKVLIEKSLSLDEKNAYAYKSLGIYYIKKEDTEMAKISFAKAKELDVDIELDNYEIYL